MKNEAHYVITIRRTVEQIATVEVHAKSSEDARKRAAALADAPRSGLWREGDLVDESFSTTALTAGGSHCKEHCGGSKP